MLVGLWVGLLKSKDFDFGQLMPWLLLSSALILYYIFYARLITIATLTSQGVVVKGDTLFLWSDIKSIHRRSQLYTMKLKSSKKIYIFPIDHLAGLGTFYSDSTMEQKVNLMKRKYGI
jgi:hypothetical protein